MSTKDDKTVIYGIAPRREEWFPYAEHEWRRRASGKTFCRGCMRVRWDLYPRPVHVKLEQLSGGMIVGSTLLAVIGIIHRRLLSVVEEYLASHVSLGDVYDRSGAKLRDFRTFYSRDCINVRGSSSSEIRECLICGRVSVLPEGDRYVLTHQLGDRHIYHDAFCSMYISAWLAGRIDWDRFKEVELYPIPVRTYPQDGLRLPGDPDWSALGVPAASYVPKVLNLQSLQNAPVADVEAFEDRMDGTGISGLLPPLPKVTAPERFRYFARESARAGSSSGSGLVRAAIYRLALRDDRWPVVDYEWRDKVSGKMFCRGCGRILQALFPQPIYVKLSELPDGLSVGPVEGAAIGIIHVRFLHRLMDHINGFAFGDVYGRREAKIDEYRTWYPDRVILIRGSGAPQPRECQACGGIDYRIVGDPYVLRHQMGTRHVYHDDKCNIYVDDWLADLVDWSDFPDLRLDPVPIRDYPEDGWCLPGDPDWQLLGVECRYLRSTACPAAGKEAGHLYAGWDSPSRLEDSGATGSCPPAPTRLGLNLKYYAGPWTGMAGFVGENGRCFLCGLVGPCFELDRAICPELPSAARKGKAACIACLRAGRFGFWHRTDIGTLGEKGRVDEQGRRLRLPKGFARQALVDLRRTPQIACNQEELWLTHCDDFMAYQGVWNPSDFYSHAADGNGRELFLQMTDHGRELWDDCWLDKTQPLTTWYATYYTFKCLHCGRLRGTWDTD